jgi:hypothetical protein
MAASKEDVARELVRAHFEVEPGLTRVFLIRSDDWGEPKKPIKLLEINANTLSAGSVDPYSFTPTEDEARGIPRAIRRTLRRSGMGASLAGPAAEPCRGPRAHPDERADPRAPHRNRELNRKPQGLARGSARRTHRSRPSGDERSE